MELHSYRHDIDGLRGISIIGVVACHAGIPGFNGGYTGVDIFFVISGYLITGILLRSSLDKKSILDFYYRRARRILPALFTMLFALAIASYWTLAPTDLISLSKSLLATTVFSSNFYFWLVSGYFGPAAEEQPLLHTWSLAVEEQFYLLFPFVLIIIRIGFLKRHIGAIFLVGALVSLALAQYEVGKPATAAFFLLPTRAWEILVGCLLAALGAEKCRMPALVLPFAVALIGLPIVFFDEATPFPGWNAIPTVTGAALLMVAGADQTSRANRVLASPLFVWLGRRSYSLYLWHWPLLVLPTMWLARPLDVAEKVIFCSLALVIATASYTFVERPFLAERVLDGRRDRVILGAMTAIILSCAAGLVVALDGLPDRVPASVRVAETDARSPWKIMARPCERNKIGYAANWCVFAPRGVSRGTVVVWGDSHAEQFGVTIAADLVPLGYSVALATFGSCPPLPGQRIVIGNAASEKSRGCNSFNLETGATLLHTLPDLRMVILAARWLPYLPIGKPDDRWLAGPDGSRTALNVSALEMQSGLERSVIQMGTRQVPVLIIDQAASFSRSPPSCVRRALMRGKSVKVCDEIANSTTTRSILSGLIVRASQRDILARSFHPADSLCRNGLCSPTMNGRLLYRDTNHLSVAGARYFAPLLLPVLKHRLAAMPVQSKHIREQRFTGG
ncbi:MAG TPA: acyltransferase family protein [Sphingomonas sp.]|nr:acyltransferase family protein [Sphingomonas sp.]